MREDLLNELENEYEKIRIKNQTTETERLSNIRNAFPDVYKLVREREELVFGTLRNIVNRHAEETDLAGRMEDLNLLIRESLKRNGLPENYLCPIYQCSKCRDTGYCGEPVKEPCSCLLRAYQQKLREKIGLSSGKDETFESYDEKLIPEIINQETGITQRKQTKLVRDACERWADQYPRNKCRDLLLTGKSGLGKTFLLHAMANRLIERGENVLIVSAYTFLQMARKSYFDGELCTGDLSDVSVLMIDDLGSEPMMQNITIEQLFHLLNERQSKNLSTVISTNLSIEELQKRYTERIASRINNPKNCLILTLDGQDLRKLER